MSNVVHLLLKYRKCVRPVPLRRSIVSMKAEILINGVSIVSCESKEHENLSAFMVDMRTKVANIREALKLSFVESVIKIEQV